MDEDDDAGFDDADQMDDDFGIEEFDYNEEKKKWREKVGKLNPEHLKVLGYEDLLEKQEKIISKANEVLAVDSALTRLVLQHCGWNVDNLLQQFFEKGEKLYTEAGIDKAALKNTNSSSQSSSQESKRPLPTECDICMSDIEPNSAVSVSCGHSFCVDCWRSYFKVKIEEESLNITNITCMGRGCKTKVDLSTVSRVLGDTSPVFKKYVRHLMNAYVKTLPLVAWCPGPDCERAIKITTGNTKVSVTCNCKHSFCFNCGMEPHQPATCGMLINWKKKVADDSETFNWLHANTKLCPKCDNPVEKNGGCNHISCKCGAHFCWMCNKLFSTATVYNHNCNMFDDSKAFEGDNHQTAKARLERYTHYITRYDTHDKSRKMESKLLENIREKMRKMAELDKGNTSWIDQRYLEESTKQLFLCRDILKFTYVFAYYLFDLDLNSASPQILDDFPPFDHAFEQKKAKEQFEFHQEELEVTTERLSGMLELPATKILAQKDYRISVIDLTKLALNKFNAMFGVVKWIKTQGATGSWERRKNNTNNKGGGAKNSPAPVKEEKKGKRNAFGRRTTRQEAPEEVVQPVVAPPAVVVGAGRGARRQAEFADEDIRAAIAASLAEAPAGGGDEDDDLARALAASLNEK
eukprot:TRINITY_DN899_c0_g1_i2.p1 TRINITY_DN899_c0_g1~~TRINITY_DN899_c0_g1_i2.p1  ORF type:complete len:708 (-),score=184.29 TRINITY_DN899_c0_g1_i2:63-1970(-)